jgi:hypothetical protein
VSRPRLGLVVVVLLGLAPAAATAERAAAIAVPQSKKAEWLAAKGGATGADAASVRAAWDKQLQAQAEADAELQAALAEIELG